jgi:hypothetical protein
VRKNYHVINYQRKASERHLAQFFRSNGQGLLPMVELIEQWRLAVDEPIEVLGRHTVEAMLEVSATDRPGPVRKAKLVEM